MAGAHGTANGGRGGWGRIRGIAAFRTAVIRYTQKGVVLQYQRACSALCNAAAGARAALMQPLSNRDQEHPKYYTLLQLEQGGHPC